MDNPETLATQTQKTQDEDKKEKKDSTMQKTI